MRSSRTTPPAPSFSLPRVLALAIAMSAHVALLAVLLQPPSPYRAPAIHVVADVNSALVVRFVPRVTPSQPSAPPSSPRSLSAALPKHSRTAPNVTSSAPVVAAASPAPPPPISGVPAYIPGGRGLSSALEPVATPSRSLPGGLPVKDMPRFRMANPQTQDMAGVARLLQVFTGTADPACVDVDRWGTMSEDQRIAQHSSTADMTRIAIEHNCALAPSTQNR